ncbi:MAG: hypothetical protein ACI3XG_08375 [Faecousia sp.]
MAKDSGGIDFSELMKIANSPAGQELISLVQKNKGEHFDEAMQQAQAGDFSQAQAMISQILSTPEAKDLMKKIRGNE